MALVDPATGQALPGDAIQRVLLVAHPVHVYRIPPLASVQGHSAAAWTADPSRRIFLARLRVVETAAPGAPPKVDVVLEDPSGGGLFAAAPYAHPSAVEPVLDSSRFFALTVRDPSGRRAVLGIGFEDRAHAFDLAAALEDARRALGLRTRDAGPPAADAVAREGPRDYSLKEGETITAFALPPPPSADDARRKRRSLRDMGFDDGQFGEFA
ncbi:uncharacterized protein UV8b_01022 [Ustilaginoidea virens]|uniref:NECAP PHear domain-containing protein n=1 Tax=Ustilaginoidea virens TaxID=1159556 RepID=A0A8E5HJU1_USTVR|nr:uncharacterized protein UV8b_01022 [Ustilaginoidea virens]QUC16781.1 hypothetical protein UV8b_01022 [Ustilaginoidea virens]